jgi:hypothetical protein
MWQISGGGAGAESCQRSCIDHGPYGTLVRLASAAPFKREPLACGAFSSKREQHDAGRGHQGGDRIGQRRSRADEVASAAGLDGHGREGDRVAASDVKDLRDQQGDSEAPRIANDPEGDGQRVPSGVLSRLISFPVKVWSPSIPWYVSCPE